MSVDQSAVEVDLLCSADVVFITARWWLPALSCQVAINIKWVFYRNDDQDLSPYIRL